LVGKRHKIRFAMQEAVRTSNFELQNNSLLNVLWHELYTVLIIAVKTCLNIYSGVMALNETEDILRC
jgi:ubiquinone biosynthesis protein Coq4